jgi:hypothetical protein
MERMDSQASSRSPTKYPLQLAGNYPDSLPISGAALSLAALNLPNLGYLLDSPRTAAGVVRARVSVEDIKAAQGGGSVRRSRNSTANTGNVTVNSYDHTKATMSSSLTLEAFFYGLSKDYRGTGWGDGWLKTVRNSPNLDQDIVGRFEREIIDGIQSSRSSQANALSTLNIDSPLQLDQDIGMEVYTRLEAVSSAIQGRLGNKEADLFPYMQQLNEQLIARLDQINPTRNLALYEGIESDPISDLPLFLFSPGALIESAGSGAVRVTGRVAAAESIPKFRNLAPLDELARFNPFPLKSVQRGYTGKLEYVVLESGELVFGKGQGHINLSRGADVLAAGEAKFFQGAVKRIDNMSGHYRPTGTSAQNAAEAAFNRSGFDATGRYVERKF